VGIITLFPPFLYRGVIILKKINYLVLITISLALILNFSPIIRSSAKTSTILDINTTPKEYFIIVDRLKPGDKILSSIEVRNIGNLNFFYNLKSEFTSGSKEYFNALLFSIKDEKGKVIYSGKLDSSQELLKKRNLRFLTKEKLFFEIDVPIELNNFYQGLSTNVKLVFLAEDSMGTSINGNSLPNTGTPMFNYVVTGAIMLVIGLLFEFYRRKKLDIKN
jgi:LPXTG-motif cell wall-anchored protein